jgi:hypothetical protein
MKEAQLANNPLETVIEDPVRLFAARREAIERTVDPKVKDYQLFYWHYDRETNPPLVLENPDIPEEEKPQRLSTIRGIVRPLFSRVYWNELR